MLPGIIALILMLSADESSAEGFWSQEEHIELSVSNPNVDAKDLFGQSLALHGDTLVVGVQQDSGPGYAYVYVKTGLTTWSINDRLIASDRAPKDYFGGSVAIYEDTILVCARGDDDKGGFSGSAYVYVRSGGAWMQKQKLTASDGASGDAFGTSCAIDGDTILIGAKYDDDKGLKSGSAYVFVRSGTTWTQQQKLTASDGAAGDWFGISVDLDGETAVIGATPDNGEGSHSGSAYVFVRSGLTWSQYQKLVPSDGAEADEFGLSVALDGNTILIGAPKADAWLGATWNGWKRGSAYVFACDGTTWSLQQKLTPNDGEQYDYDDYDGMMYYFGTSVALDGNTILIGVPGSNLNQPGASFARTGSVHVFFRSGTTWSLQQNRLTANDAESWDYFGSSVAFDSHTFFVGAPSKQSINSTIGSVYSYEKYAFPSPPPPPPPHPSPPPAFTACASGSILTGLLGLIYATVVAFVIV